jgi:hypothetical protein
MVAQSRWSAKPDVSLSAYPAPQHLGCCHQYRSDGLDEIHPLLFSYHGNVGAEAASFGIHPFHPRLLG